MFLLCLLCDFLEIPVTFVVPLTDISTTEGQTVTLECKISKPGHKVTWYKDGKKLQKPEGEMDEDGVTFRLTLTDASPIDAASYTAKVAKDQTQAKVTVSGVCRHLKPIIKMNHKMLSCTFEHKLESIPDYFSSTHPILLQPNMPI